MRFILILLNRRTLKNVIRSAVIGREGYGSSANEVRVIHARDGGKVGWYVWILAAFHDAVPNAWSSYVVNSSGIFPQKYITRLSQKMMQLMRYNKRTIIFNLFMYLHELFRLPLHSFIVQECIRPSNVTVGVTAFCSSLVRARWYKSEIIAVTVLKTAF